MRRFVFALLLAATASLGWGSSLFSARSVRPSLLASAAFQQPIAAIDYQAALTATPYLAFSGNPSSAQRPAVDIGTAVSNTAAVWVVVLPSSASAPANLAAIQSNPTSYVLNPGDRLIGGADTGLPSTIYVASATGTQAVTMQGKSLPASSTSVLRYVSSNGLVTSNAGKATPLIAASQLGNISGTYASGVHKISQIVGENASGSTVYLQVYDATSQPSNGTVPIAEVTVSFGISTAPTGNRLVMTPDYLATSTGVWFCFVTAPGAFNSANLVSSGSGLLVRCYGQ